MQGNITQCSLNLQICKATAGEAEAMEALIGGVQRASHTQPLPWQQIEGCDWLRGVQIIHLLVSKLAAPLASTAIPFPVHLDL